MTIVQGPSSLSLFVTLGSEVIVVALALLGMLAGASETQQWKAAQSSAMQCNAVQCSAGLHQRQQAIRFGGRIHLDRRLALCNASHDLEVIFALTWFIVVVMAWPSGTN